MFGQSSALLVLHLTLHLLFIPVSIGSVAALLVLLLIVFRLNIRFTIQETYIAGGEKAMLKLSAILLTLVVTTMILYCMQSGKRRGGCRSESKS
jgi:hypothetical protein